MEFCGGRVAFRFSISILPFLLAALLGCSDGPRRARAVVLVTLDTTRADRLGCYGNTSIETPTLDGVARDGALFEQASTVAPLTLPAHASILTGRYPAQHGVHHNGLYVLPESERTLAEIFREAGYDTAAFIAAFPLSSRFGLRQGFTTWDETFGPAAAERKFLYEERDAAAVNAAVLRWLASRKGRPFFLWVHYFDAHVPYHPPAPYRERYAENPYDGEIAFVDSRLGELLEQLGRLVPAGETVLAVVGDHGESLHQHGEVTHGLFIYEATIRVPFLLWAPGRIPRATRIFEPVSLVDLFPTLLHLAGRPPPSVADHIAGRDLEPELVAGHAGRGAMGAEILFESLLPRLEHGWSPLLGIRDGVWKYIEAPRPELYALGSDPGEERNLLAAGDADSSSQTRAIRMKARLDAFLAALPVSEAVSAGPALDEHSLLRLQSLGYLQAGGSTGDIHQASPTAADPKDMVGVHESLNDIALLLKKGDVERAVAEGRGLLDSWPQEPAVQRAYGETLLAAKQYDLLERFLQSMEKAAIPWVTSLRARALEEQGNVEGAIHAWRASSRDVVGADADAARLRAASLLRKAGRWRESSEEARSVNERSPLFLQALRLVSDNERELGNLQGAVSALRRASAASPDDPVVLASLGRLLLESRSLEEARSVGSRLASVAPGRPDGPMLLGAVAVVEGRPGRAIAPLTQARGLDPDDPDVLYWLGAAFLDLGDPARAEEPVLSLVAKHPGAWQGHRCLGRLRMAQDRPEEAIRAFRRALTLHPGDAVSIRCLSELGAKG